MVVPTHCRPGKSGHWTKVDSTSDTLGADAVDAIAAHLDAVRSELRAWDTVARDTLVD